MSVETQQQMILATLAGGPRSPADLKQALGGISPATLSRLMARLGRQVIALGQTRAIRYARPRDLRGMRGSFPVYQVNTAGDVHRFGELLSLLGGSFWWQPAEAGVRGELYPHLPGLSLGVRSCFLNFRSVITGEIKNKDLTPRT